MRSLILCGGKGERLRPLTFEINKVLIPVKNNEYNTIFKLNTLLDEVVSLFSKFNVFEVWLVGGYKVNQLMDRYNFPMIVERQPMGTGGWLKMVDPNMFTEDFFVCNGDNLFDIDLREMLKHHKDTNAVITIACTKVKDIRPFGSVHIKNGRISSFEEKKSCRTKKSGFINAGYYLFSPKIFDYVDKSLDKISLEYDVFPKLAADGKLSAYVSDKQWFSCNNFEEYEKIIKEWKGVSAVGGGNVDDKGRFD